MFENYLCLLRTLLRRKEFKSILSWLDLAWLGSCSYCDRFADMRCNDTQTVLLEKSDSTSSSSSTGIHSTYTQRPAHTYHFRCYYIRILFRLSCSIFSLSWYFVFCQSKFAALFRCVFIHTQCVCVVQKSLRLISIESMNFIIRCQFPWRTLLFGAFFSNSWHVQFQIGNRDAAVYLHHIPHNSDSASHETDFKFQVFRSIMCFLLDFRRSAFWA